MTAHRRYTWHCEPSRVDAAAKLLGLMVAELPQFFSGLEISGAAFGLAELSVTISDRDLWWVGRRARILTEDMHLLAGVILADEQRVKPPAHDHPNRAARWKGKVDSGW